MQANGNRKGNFPKMHTSLFTEEDFIKWVKAPENNANNRLVRSPPLSVCSRSRGTDGASSKQFLTPRPRVCELRSVKEARTTPHPSDGRLRWVALGVRSKVKHLLPWEGGDALGPVAPALVGGRRRCVSHDYTRYRAAWEMRYTNTTQVALDQKDLAAVRGQADASPFDPRRR